MAKGSETGKAWAAAHLFNREEIAATEPSAERRGGEGPAAWLQRLRVGEARSEGHLEIAPLLLEGNGGPPAVLLTRQAIEAGLLEIVERGSGVVQELLAWNKGERPVAILEGDTLVGCKQNRVVAHSVIVAPGTSIGIPVGCMERGRWSQGTASFSVGDVKMAPGVRSRTIRDVKAATLSRQARTLDQSRLWTDVEAELAACGESSPTSDYYSIVKREGRGARARAERLVPEQGQVGAIVLAEGSLVGLEATGHHGLWSLLCGATLASYVLGQHRGSAPARGDRAGAADWLARVQRAEVKEARGLGLGEDLDLRGAGLSGVGVALDGVPVHVAVFRA